MFRLRSSWLILPLPLVMAWLDWRLVSRLSLWRTALLWLVCGILFGAFIGSVRYICQGNPWRPHLQLRFFLTHLVGMVAAVLMLVVPMWGLAIVLQHLFPSQQGWLTLVSLPFAAEIAAIVYIIAIFLNYFMELTRRTQQLERERLQAEAAWAQSALGGLKSAIHPHFLFNVLNMLIPVIHRDPGKAVELVDGLSSFLVLSLKMTDKRTVSIQEEFQHARLYLDLEARRIGERLKVDWQVHIDDQHEIFVPPLIVLPLLENAVKHGVAMVSGAAWVELSCVLDGQWLDIRLANSIGENGEEKGTAPGLGLGLRNLRQRLELYYQGGFSMRSACLQDRYWVHLRIPVVAKGRES